MEGYCLKKMEFKSCRNHIGQYWYFCLFCSNNVLKDNTAVSLFVINVANGLSKKQALEVIGGNETTINNVTGYIINDDDVFIFNFEKNDRLVMISSNDKNVIGDFLMV